MLNSIISLISNLIYFIYNITNSIYAHNKENLFLRSYIYNQQMCDRIEKAIKTNNYALLLKSINHKNNILELEFVIEKIIQYQNLEMLQSLGSLAKEGCNINTLHYAINTKNLKLIKLIKK